MFQFNAPHSLAGSRLPHASDLTPTIGIVDTRPDDYESWREVAKAHGLRLKVLASAAEAFRLRRGEQVDLWVVNTQLPDLSGCELCSMLKTQSPRTPVFLVSDEYSPALEQDAWQSRATLFGVKGSHLPWLENWLAGVTANSQRRTPNLIHGAR